MSVARSSLIFTLGTLISRFAGLLRDRIVLGVFGASDAMSAFVIAFRIPNMLREMLAEGALGSSFTKVYSQLVEQDRKRAQRLLIDALLLMTVVSILITVAGIFAAPGLVNLMTSEAESSEAMVAMATGLTKLLFPFLGFMILGAIIMGALHQRGAFFITSASPVFFNIFNIIGALLFSQWLERYGPAWIDGAIAPRRITGFALGVLCGGAAQLLLQLIGATRELKAALRESTWHVPWSSDMRNMLLLMGPMALAASAGQIRTVINNYFATTAGSSAVVWLDSSFRLLQLPIGLFGVAISSAVLPPLSRAIAAAGGAVDRQASQHMQNAIEMVTWLMAPCLAFYAVNSLDVVRCLLQSGHFSAEDAQQTARALFAYSFALPGYGLSKVMTSFFFALERTRYALAVSLVTILANTSMNWYLVAHFGHTGLAWGYASTQTLSILLYISGMRGQKIQMEWSRFSRSMVLLSTAVLLSLGGMSILREFWEAWAVLKTGSPLWDSGALLLINGIFCLSIFGGLAMIDLKLTPKAAWSKLRRRRHVR